MAGRIKELAKKDIDAATVLAFRGHEFTEIEALLQLYYGNWHEMEQIQSGTKTDVQKLLTIETDPAGAKVWTPEMNDIYKMTLQTNFKELSDDLCGIFINAVNTGDSKKIFEIGKAIEFLKTFKSSESGDLFRAKILTWKTILDKKGERWPIRRLAKSIDWPMADSVNGFWNLKRIANELNFPLVASLK